MYCKYERNLARVNMMSECHLELLGRVLFSRSLVSKWRVSTRDWFHGAIARPPSVNPPEVDNSFIIIMR